MKKTDQIQNTEVVTDASGRQYHIALAPGEISPYIILVGEAKRAERAAKLLDNIRVEQYNREYHTFTGNYKGTEVTIMSTGMGPGCIEIGMVEIFQITKNPAFIRVGTSGILQPHIGLGDLIISSGAVRLEDTSTFFVHEGYPAVANYEVVAALVKSADTENVPYHVGITATGSGFYGAQGRDIPGLYIRDTGIPEEMGKMNVYNFEMEASTIFNLANTMGLRASAVCTGIFHRVTGQAVSSDLKAQREKEALTTALEALLLVEKMDKKKEAAGKKYWVPETI